MRLLINPLWRCQNQCSYCWVEKTVRLRPELYRVQERMLDDWLLAIFKLEPGDTVDICGGEPLLLEWLPEFCRVLNENSITWAITTNLQYLPGLERFLEVNPRGGGFTVSFHPESKWRFPEFLRRVVKMGNYYAPSINVIDTVAVECADEIAILRGGGAHVFVSPYEEPLDLTERSEQGFCCKGGEQHLTIAPDGSAWPCLTSLRSPRWKEYRLGNFLDEELDLTRKPQPCHLMCEQYLILKDHPAGEDIWDVEAHPCA